MSGNQSTRLKVNSSQPFSYDELSLMIKTDIKQFHKTVTSWSCAQLTVRNCSRTGRQFFNVHTFITKQSFCNRRKYTILFTYVKNNFFVTHTGRRKLFFKSTLLVSFPLNATMKSHHSARHVCYPEVDRCCAVSVILNSELA